MVKGGGQGAGEYPSELLSELRFMVGQAGCARYCAEVCWHFMRPFSREGGEPEVVPRMFSPSVPTGTGRFFVPSGEFKQKGDGKMQIYEELKARGLIAQVTDEEEIREIGRAHV